MQLCLRKWAAILASCVSVCVYVHLTLCAPGVKQLLHAGLQMYIDFKITDFLFLCVLTETQGFVGAGKLLQNQAHFVQTQKTSNWWQQL